MSLSENLEYISHASAYSFYEFH